MAVLSGGLLTFDSLAAHSTLKSDPDYLIDTWETEDGLPEDSGTCMAQTPDGYLWIGTFYGLVRFDGVTFTVFNPRNTPQLPSELIVNLHADRRGWLWISTHNGLVVRAGTKWRDFGQEPGLRNDFVRTFAERKSGEVLITTFRGGIFEFSSNRLAALPDPPGVKGGGYFGVADELGKWRVAQNGFVGVWDGQHWTKTVPSMDRLNLAAEDVCAAPGRDGGWWLLLGAELRKYRGNEEIFRLKLSERPGQIWSVYEDSHTNIWACTQDRGVCKIASDGQMHRWNKDNGLFCTGTRFAFEDREQNIWVGTSGGGLLRFKQRRFQSFGLESGLTERAVRSVASHPDGTVLVGTYGGGLFRLGEGGVSPVPFRGREGMNNFVMSTVVDRNGRTWAGTDGRGLWISDSNVLQHVPDKLEPGKVILALFMDSRGKIWVSDDDGVTVFDAAKTSRYRLGQGATTDRVRCFGEDSAGAIWVSNLKAVFRMQNERFVEVCDESNCSIEEVQCLRGESEGTVWMGTIKDGLLRWKHGKLGRVDAKHGLPVPDVSGFVEDNEQFFWMATSRGILRVHRKNLESVAEGTGTQLNAQLLDVSDGLPGVECAIGVQPTCARDTKGRLWFAMAKGVAVTDPARLVLNTNAPPMQIESLAYRGVGRGKGRPLGSSATEVRLEPPFTERLTLPAGSRRIELRYTALSFCAAEKIRFQTRLDGRDTEWDDAGQQRVAVFQDLPPGKYTFHVRAANNDDVWNQDGAMLAFAVQPFFWQTGWFRGVIGSAVVGEALLIAGLLVNLRARHRAERSLAESEARFRIAADEAPVMIWLAGVDKLCTYFNKPWFEFTGRTLELEIGKGWIDGVHPDDLQRCVRTYEQAFEARQSFVMEYRLRRHDGEYRWVSDTGKPRHDARGTFAGYIGSCVDITERKRADEKFRVAVEAAPNAIVMINAQGHILLANSLTDRVFGYSREELLGQPVEMLLPERYRRRYPTHRREIFAAPEGRVMGAGGEVFARRKDGSEFPAEIRLNPIHVEEGVLVLASIVDLTERRTAELQMQQHRQELAHFSRLSIMGELSASMAHELNQPLAAILANTGAAQRFLANSEADPGEVGEILKDITQDTIRARDVIRHVRALVKKGGQEFSDLKVDKAIREVVGFLHGDIVARNGRVELDLAPDLPPVRSDPIQFQQVVVNLVLNAFDAMDCGSFQKRRVIISAKREQPGGVRVTVRDYGTGIPTDKLELIFQPFFTTKSDGMGMGLSVTRTIVESQGGQIWAENHSGGGAEFHITLPVANGEP